MSMNLGCVLVFEPRVKSTIELVQTDTCSTGRIMAAGGPAGRNWQAVARAYLAWVKEQFDGDSYVVKRERRSIGRAWQAAEEHGGRLVFFVG